MRHIIKKSLLIAALLTILLTTGSVLAAPLYGIDVLCPLHGDYNEVCGCNDDDPGYYCLGGKVYWYNSNCSLWNDPLVCPSGICHCAKDGYADHCKEHCH